MRPTCVRGLLAFHRPDRNALTAATTNIEAWRFVRRRFR
jgi:hypothetical protein